jgi:hypothetical protein
LIVLPYNASMLVKHQCRSYWIWSNKDSGYKMQNNFTSSGENARTLSYNDGKFVASMPKPVNAINNSMSGAYCQSNL